MVVGKREYVFEYWRKRGDFMVYRSVERFGFGLALNRGHSGETQTGSKYVLNILFKKSLFALRTSP